MKQKTIEIPLAAQRKMGTLLCKELKNFYNPNPQWSQIEKPKLKDEFFNLIGLLPADNNTETLYVRNYQRGENKTVMTIVVSEDRFIVQCQIHVMDTVFLHCSKHCEETKKLRESLECTLQRQENSELDQVLSLALYQISSSEE